MRPCGCVVDPRVFGHTSCPGSVPLPPEPSVVPLCPGGRCLRQHELPRLTLIEYMKLARTVTR